MKKFAKLAAVFAALVLAWACFVACSNGDDDSTSVQALQGLWIYDDIYGYYFSGNTLYYAILKDTTWYYDKEEADKFSVSGDKIILKYYDGDEYYEDEIYFEINSNTMTWKYYEEKESQWHTDILKKITTPLIGVSSQQFDNIYNSLFADSDE